MLLLALAGCAGLERPQPLSGAELVVLAREGKTPQQMIDELKRTDTVLMLQASDIVQLHESGVPNEVLDYLQRAQIEEIRRRERQQQMYWGPLHGGFGSWPRGR